MTLQHPKFRLALAGVAVVLTLAACGGTDGERTGPIQMPTGRILVHRTPAGDASVTEVVIVNLDGSEERNLSNASGSDFWAVWSPDGRRVAFAANRDGNSEIYVINADGSGLVNLTNSPTPDSGVLAWSPDGRRIAFGSSRDGTNAAKLYVMDDDGSNVIRLSALENAHYPAWSPDGQRIAFVSDAGLHVVNADGTGEALLVTIEGARFPSWTPDGRRIVFAAWYAVGSTRFGDIYIVNSDGSGLENLTDDPAYDSLPFLSPDGQRILFNSDRRQPDDMYGGFNAYVMNIDGSQATPLVNLPLRLSCEPGCSWSPDGAYIVGTLNASAPDSSALVFVSADGRVVTMLTGVGGVMPQWSP